MHNIDDEIINKFKEIDKRMTMLTELMESTNFVSDKSKFQVQDECHAKAVKFRRQVSEIAIKRKRRIFNSKTSLAMINKRFGHETIRSNIVICNNNEDYENRKLYEKNDTIGFVQQNKTKIGEGLKLTKLNSNNSIELHSYVSENDVRLEESNSLSNAIQMTPKRVKLGLVSKRNTSKDLANDSSMKIDTNDIYINVPYINKDIIEEHSEEESG